MANLKCVLLVVSALGLFLAVPSPAFADEGRWTPAQVEEATRLNDIVFFKERIERGQGRSVRPYHISGAVLRGSASGLESLSSRLASPQAARSGKLGLRLSITTEGDDPAWRIRIEPEIAPPIDDSPRIRPYFDAYAYGPQGAVEFDLRGAAKGRGLGVAFSTFYQGRSHEPPRLTPLDPYLADTADWQHVVIPVADMDLDSPGTQLNVANRLVVGGDGWAGTLDIALDNIVLRSDGPEPERGPVRVNHVGYLPDSRKIGLVCGSRLFGLAGRPFVVRKAGSDGEPVGEAILRGTLKLRGEFEPKVYGEWAYEADFTPVQQQGRYVLEVPGVGSSVPFYVHEAIYDYVFYHVARFFFYQRNGCALPAKNAFEWARGEIYARPVPFASDESKTKVVRHGWFDAGDSRIFPHTDRLATMLLAWEMSRDKHFDGQLNIPESGNGVPDMLDEMRWQVEYFREMQLENGACLGYLLTGKGGGGPIDGRNMGYENDPDPRYIRDGRFSHGLHMQIGACMAMMARYLKSYDREAAETYGAAALRAWNWAEGNRPEPREGRRAPSPANRLWAAVELWRLTGREQFHAVIRDLADTPARWSGVSWRGSTHRAWVSYALDPNGDPALRQQFRKRFVEQLDVLLELSAKDPYGVAVRPQGWFFNPGSMGKAAALLLMAWNLTEQDKYRTLAEEYMHYVCGRNVYRVCDISNVAPETHGEPFHMLEWTPDRKAWMPGYVINMNVDHGGNLSRFIARRWRQARWCWYFSEPCVGTNFGPTAAAMMLMQGKRYDDLIHQGAFPGVRPFRPGLPYAPSDLVRYGAEPVIPGPAE